MKRTEGNRFQAVRYRKFLITLYNSSAIISAYGTAFLLRFDFAVPRVELPQLFEGLALAYPVKMAVFYAVRLHKGWWKYVGMNDLMRALLGNIMASALFTVLALMLIGSQFPRSIYFIDFLVCFLAMCGGRFAVRWYNEAVVREVSKESKGVLIYGAGGSGITLARDIRKTPKLKYDVLGFVDDDPGKVSHRIFGLPVLGFGRDLPHIVDSWNRGKKKRIEEIIVAMPSATGREMREALANCRATGLPCKTIPGVGELLEGQVLSSQIRSVSLNDLLGREPIRLEEDRIRAHIAGRVVLVTGAGGSIGSELCRQVAQFGPARLVALDQAESDLFRIDHEIRSKHPGIDIAPEIADIRNDRRVEDLIRTHAVHSIFHAAAYKHVPMMERHVMEAVQNNIVGTWNVAQAAYRNGVSNFLMISSDKAVNPTSVMGATKRVAELIVSAMSSEGGSARTKFVSVRFGNVLGSNGSVVPLFQEQIAAGGPVTVTHPNVKRYFMTIREAVQLVLQASTMGNGSEIFVLDMGEPIRIVDLARNMIRLSGKVPDEEIEIRFVGLRPGEKLYEEIMIKGENIAPTFHEKIKIFRGARLTAMDIRSWMSDLRVLMSAGDVSGALSHIRDIVPEYAPEQNGQPVLARAAAGQNFN
jgi:FlaA1/EpsC-like NDP-sugar epimerase